MDVLAEIDLFKKISWIKENAEPDKIEGILSILDSVIFNIIEEEEKFLWILKTKNPVAIRSPDTILTALLFYKDEIRESSRGYYKIKDVFLSKTDFDFLKKQEKVDDSVEEIGFCGIKIIKKDWIPKNKIIVFIDSDDTKLKSINDQIKVLEIVNDDAN